jgi:hypothetical protein
VLGSSARSFIWVRVSGNSLGPANPSKDEAVRLRPSLRGTTARQIPRYVRIRPGSEWQEYEKTVREVYQAFLRREGSKAEVQHNVKIRGKSGVQHQIDVCWKMRQAGLEHMHLVDCKDFARSVSIEKVRNWLGVVQDIPNSFGVIVTREGYQSGAADFAKFNGIRLKVMRHPRRTGKAECARSILSCTRKRSWGRTTNLLKSLPR